ncbi:uncharacterized protein B0H18DRAFT_410704 [Fomitopsis serialis]|uniref:uncharacterized protein n=1 Tax=Fomitopsis serialis TaxID=139415 RepID=UPI002007B55F|nr:uncharacterized protein B0H18DRAFT_410704 [Neoantrodia serialis]KAH9935333.1 hypothetical protein B0H18DRAFT_410704 [Neoantrodia serialis]
MIRRDPTLIGMTDADVQQVRDMVAAKRKDELAQKWAEISDKQYAAFEAGASASQPFVAAEDAKRKREAMTKDERLGLR